MKKNQYSGSFERELIEASENVAHSWDTCDLSW
jgi:hypothetical protein